MLKELLKKLGIFILILLWMFTGWPILWQDPRIPPKVQEAQAATLTYVGGAEASGNSASFNVSLTGLTGGVASSPSQGDLVIVATGFVSTANGDPGVSTTGYTEVADLYDNDSRDANFSANWKIMGGTPDSSVSCNGSGSTSNGAVCVVHVWRNANSSTPLDVTTTTATARNSAIPNSPSITPVTAGAIVISAGLGTGAAADTSVTAPTGYGNQVDVSVDPGNAATVGISSKAWGGSGAEDPAAWTNWTTSTADSWAAAALAIRPASPNAPSQDSPANGVTGVSVTPTFTMTSTDPSSNNLGYKVTIYSDSACTTVVQTNDQGVSSTGWTGTNATCTNSPTSCYTSGTQGSFLTQTALLNSTQYWWKASAKDPDGSKTFTDSSTCNTFTTAAAATVSVSVADGSVSYGTIAAGASKDTTSTGLNDTQTATNDGNVTENFNIKTSNATGGTQLTVGATPGTDVFVHEFSTNGGGAWTKFTAADSYQTLATGIAASGTQNFDLKITVPTTSSDYQQKSITVTVQAVQQ